MGDVSAAAGARSVPGRTAAALGVVLRRRDARLVLAGSAVAYLLAYSVAVGDLGPSRASEPSLAVVSDPVARMLEPVGVLSYEPIARVSGFGLTYLFSPVDALLAIVLAVLVGANLALTYLGVVQPRSCGLEASSGVLATVPALFSGAACCGPAILVVAGIQATGLLVAGFRLLVPLALVLLVGSLLLVGRKVDPSLL